ncbi:hypothetical protein [Subtercola endophyticus]|uniref:hypothetical protein n=1 Tax=Subtercola endophyticus TaxID=2895559 RepID=UPI001E428CF4|nr:hypothetical protein [Subtercola endophyticus]UFS58673.1 hypothetical protein LQ955_17005 [Subtercola endophyticus]
MTVVTLRSRVAAVLIPAGARLVGAGELDIDARIGAVLTAIPALVAPFDRALATVAAAAGAGAGAAAAESLSPALAALERSDPAAFAALREVTVIAWATSDDVQHALPLAPRVPLDVERWRASDDLLDPVRRRGAIWRREEPL